MRVPGFGDETDDAPRLPEGRTSGRVSAGRRKQPVRADTWYRNRAGQHGVFQSMAFLADPSRFVDSPVKPPAYLLNHVTGELTAQCHSNDGLVFAIAPLVPRR
jgi:hypothetical protein